MKPPKTGGKPSCCESRSQWPRVESSAFYFSHTHHFLKKDGEATRSMSVNVWLLMCVPSCCCGFLPPPGTYAMHQASRQLAAPAEAWEESNLHSSIDGPGKIVAFLKGRILNQVCRGLWSMELSLKSDFRKGIAQLFVPKKGASAIGRKGKCSWEACIFCCQLH